MGCVYQLCFPNGKSYIGKTKRTLAIRWTCHKSAAKSGKKNVLYNAIRKYGYENVEPKILFESDDIEILNLLEIEFIGRLNTNRVNGYNMTCGGDGVPELNEEASARRRQKMKESWTPERKEKLFEAIEKRDLSSFIDGLRKFWSDPNNAKRVNEKRKLTLEKPEYKQMIRERSINNWADPEIRKKMIGENQGRAKLTNQQVLEIRELLLTGHRNGAAIGRMYGVHKDTISNIKTGKIWSHLTGFGK